MGKYHINGKGKVERCRATVRPCPLAGESIHVEANSPEEAQEKVYDQMKKENPILAISKRSGGDHKYAKYIGMSNEELDKDFGYDWERSYNSDGIPIRRIETLKKIYGEDFDYEKFLDKDERIRESKERFAESRRKAQAKMDAKEAAETRPNPAMAKYKGMTNRELDEIFWDDWEGGYEDGMSLRRIRTLKRIYGNDFNYKGFFQKDKENQKLAESVALDLHSDWAENWRKNNPGDRRLKPANEGDYTDWTDKNPNHIWVASADGGKNWDEVPKGTEGAVPGLDIANTEYKDLPEHWKKENRAAGEVVAKTIDQNMTREQAGAYIHDKWLERNSWAKGGDLDKPFGQLSKVEQDKDLAQFDIGMKYKEMQK